MPIKNRSIGIPRAGVIRLGSPKGHNSPGRNLSYFRVESEYFTPQQLAEALGPEPNQLRIKFPRMDRQNDERSLDFVFDASYKAYKNGALFCKGDGESAMRAIAKGKLEQVPCTCELLTGKMPICKQRGDLRVVLSNLPFLGFFQIGTSSWNSINSIEAVIDLYYKILGEKFWMTEFILFKEETFLKGHKQYIMRLRVAPEYMAHLPSGSDLEQTMMFEDDTQEFEEGPAPEPQLPPSDSQSEAVSEPVTVPESLAHPETSPVSVEALEEPPSDLPDVPSSDVVETPAVDETPPTNSGVSPERLAPLPDVPSEPANSTSEPPQERVLTPQRRSKEAQLKMICKQFAVVGNEAAHQLWETGEKTEPFNPSFTEDDPESVLRFFSGGKGFADITDDELVKYLAEIRESKLQLEWAKKQQSDEEVPF